MKSVVKVSASWLESLDLLLEEIHKKDKHATRPVAPNAPSFQNRCRSEVSGRNAAE